MKKKKMWVVPGCAILAAVLFVSVAAFAGSPVRLFVDGREMKLDVPAQTVDGRTLVPVRWVGEALGAGVSWDSEGNSVHITTGDWLPQLTGALERAADEFDYAPDVDGRIESLWRVDKSLILLQYVCGMDYEFYLCDSVSGEKERIVGLIENARLEEISRSEIIFTAKGGDDTGNYRFPYRLRYDTGSGELSREQLYLQRDVAFGAPWSWEHVLKEVGLDDDGFTLSLVVHEEQVLAGGHKTPFTVVSTGDNLISMRIYGVVSSETTESYLEPDHPVIERIEWKELPEKEPVDNLPLLKSDFPYGAAWDNVQYNEPSLLVDIYCRNNPAFSIDTTAGDLTLKYSVKLK